MVTEKKLSAFSLHQSQIQKSLLYFASVFFSPDYANSALPSRCPDFWPFLLLSFGPHWLTCSLKIGGQNLVWMQCPEVLLVLSKAKIFYSSFHFHLLTSCNTQTLTYKAVVPSQLFLTFNLCSRLLLTQSIIEQ